MIKDRLGQAVNLYALLLLTLAMYAAARTNKQPRRPEVAAKRSLLPNCRNLFPELFSSMPFDLLLPMSRSRSG